MDAIVLYILTATIVLINLWATVLVSRTTFLVEGRKKWQLIFIWCVPVAGAALAIYFRTEPEGPRKTYSDNPETQNEVLGAGIIHGHSGCGPGDSGGGSGGGD